MAPSILAHGNSLDELGVLAFGSSFAVAVRLLAAHRRTPDDQKEPPVTEQQPHPADADDPAASHGSDLDPRIASDDPPAQPLGADEPGS
jgi:hypothetical protein